MSADLHAFKELLARVPMAEEQRSLMELLFSLEQHVDVEGEAVRAPQEDAAVSPSVQQELADLREVNDTVAAALGACRVCWGGDPGCPACAGQGRAGWRAPDRALFQELVVPAVRRVRAIK